MTDNAKNLFNQVSNNLTNNSDDGVTRYDPITAMFNQRVIMVEGQVGTELSHHIISQLYKLSAMDSKAPITMVINSPGGSVIDGLAIYDIMRSIDCPITTVGNGMQASMGSILLAGGDTRVMMPNAMLLVHQIMGGASGGTQHSDFEISGAFMAEQHERLKSVYVEFTGLNHKFWDIVGERDSWLTAEQAKAIGFIHDVKEVPNDKRGPYADYAKRGDDGGLNSILKRETQAYINNMSADEIARRINSGSADGGAFARLRGDLIVRLSQFEQFWTPALAAEKAAKNIPSADQLLLTPTVEITLPANENQKKATKAAVKKAPGNNK